MLRIKISVILLFICVILSCCSTQKGITKGDIINEDNFKDIIVSMLSNGNLDNININTEDIPADFSVDLKNIINVDGNYFDNFIIINTSSGRKYEFKFKLDKDYKLKSLKYIKEM